jgi:hypothetical protein
VKGAVLREALTLRAAQWREALRQEPQVARTLVHRLIDPLELSDDSDCPEWMKAECAVKPALLDGLNELVASPPGFEELWMVAVSGTTRQRAA